MRLIVRFKDQGGLNKLRAKLGLALNEYTTEVNLDTGLIKYKKEIKEYHMKKTDWINEWNDMPEFRYDFADEVFAKIEFYCKDDTSLKYLSDLFEANITEATTSIWFPKWDTAEYRGYRMIGGENPKYPVYVVSKGRYVNATWHTSFRFTQSEIPHYLVVEPQEYDKYCEVFNNPYVTVLKLDMSYKDKYDTFNDIGKENGTGPGAARNFCWEHSMKNGYKWHWVFDDNIDGFARKWRGKSIITRSGEALRVCERFVERYENIAIAGINYSKFCKNGDRVPAYVLNTRIYSMLLIRNDIPYRWRGRYNEDTDLSLRALKDGWCTVQFNLILGEKLTTQRIGGGNSEEFYFKEGTKNKSQMLVDMHPDVAKLVYKFHRWHHEVDYSGFTQKLIRKSDYDFPKEDNEYGFKMVKVPRDLNNTEEDTRSIIEAKWGDGEDYLKSDKYLKPNFTRSHRGKQRKLF